MPTNNLEHLIWNSKFQNEKCSEKDSGIFEASTCIVVVSKFGFNSFLSTLNLGATNELFLLKE